AASLRKAIIKDGEAASLRKAIIKAQRRLDQACLRHEKAGIRRHHEAQRARRLESLWAEADKIRLQAKRVGDEANAYESWLSNVALLQRLELNPRAHFALLYLLAATAHEILGNGCRKPLRISMFTPSAIESEHLSALGQDRLGDNRARWFPADFSLPDLEWQAGFS
ncbi:hypothetical protein CYLTODRAFT_453745, partial [Cylindrobasidium torrendii FP15055 ss-10]